MTRAVRLAPWLVGLAAAAAFLNVLPNAFQWDDFDLLLRPEIRSWTAANVRWMATTTLFGHYVPLTWLSWALDASLWGFTPFGFHFTNLLLHAANTVLVYFLSLRLIPLFSEKPSPHPALSQGEREKSKEFPSPLGRRCPEGADERVWWAVAAALFFALHPLRVETVAWATERRGLLSAFFCLWCALRHLDGDRRWPPVLLAAAVLSKETAMAWPAALFLLDVWVLGRSTAADWLKRHWALCAVAAAGAVAGATATSRESIPVSSDVHGPHARLAQVFRGSVFLAWKSAAPFGLSPLYVLPLNAPSLSMDQWAPAAGGFLVTALAFASRRRWPVLSGAWLVWAALLLPTAGLLQSGPQDTADRYTYLAGLPWALLFGAAASKGRGRWALAVLPLLAFLSWRQQSFWRTPETLWGRAAALDDGSPYAHYNLGSAQVRSGKFDEAVGSFRRALAIHPTFEEAHYNLAAVDHRQGRFRAAEDGYRRTIWVNPRNAMARNNLGRLLLDQGRRQEARAEFEEALRLQPDSPVVRKNLEALSR